MSNRETMKRETRHWKLGVVGDHCLVSTAAITLMVMAQLSAGSALLST